MIVNYIKGLKPFSRLKVQATLYEGKSIVKHNDNTADCNWATMGLDNTRQILVPKSSKVEIDPNGKIVIRNSPGSERVVSADKEIVLPVNQEVEWYRDFSKMLREHGL